MVGGIEVAGRTIGPGRPCFIIAEAGVNHNGDLNMARRLIDAAVEAKADAVKFQTFKAERLATAQAPKAGYQLQTTDREESQLEMLRRLELSEPDHRTLMRYCQQHGILFLSSPFDEESADLLEQLGVAAFKVSSGELTNWPFLASLARSGKPLIISTGMATLKEVHAAVRVVHEAGNHRLILLHCVSRYPTEPSEVNLRAMETISIACGVPVGYSDHTLGFEVALAAAALGACVIEKHLTLDRNLRGPDHRVSLEPHEFKALVQGIRLVEAALGHGRKEPTPSEKETAASARKSLVAACDIAQGSRLTEELIAIKRPGTGLAPAMLDRILGRRAAVPIPADTVLSMEMVR